MLQLVKYEFLRRYKSVAILSLLTLLINCAIIATFGHWPDELIVGISIVVFIASSSVLFVLAIFIFSNDIYGESGYLTFSVPKSGSVILASKLIVVMIFYFIVTSISVVFLMYIGLRVKSISQGMDQAGVRFNTSHVFIMYIIYTTIAAAAGLIQVYFSIAVTRLSSFKRRFGKFSAFVVYVLLEAVIIIVNLGIEKVFKKQYYFKLFKSVSGNISSSNVDIITKGLPINEAYLVFYSVISIILFIITAYIIDNKMDV